MHFFSKKMSFFTRYLYPKYLSQKYPQELNRQRYAITYKSKVREYIIPCGP